MNLGKHKIAIPLIAFAIFSTFFACSQTVSAPKQDNIESTSSSKKDNIESTSSSKKDNIESTSSSKKITLADIYEAVEIEGWYTTRDSVASYLCKFNELPQNFVKKNEAKKLYENKGYTFSKWNFNPWQILGVMIGGDNFDNFANNPEYYHENLPEGNYFEADLEYNAKNRGTKRLVYQKNCIIYYTNDHYETFTRLEF